jgi:DNA-binding GntR family transcriptional regulator
MVIGIRSSLVRSRCGYCSEAKCSSTPMPVALVLAHLHMHKSHYRADCQNRNRTRLPITLPSLTPRNLSFKIDLLKLSTVDNPKFLPMIDLSFARHARPALHQDVYTTLKAAILEGRLKPGAPLREPEIAIQMGISRAPLREALRQLEREGLVVTSPYKGTHVATFTPKDIRELCKIRSLLEGYAIAEAVPRIKPDDVKRLTIIQKEMLAVGRQDIKLWVFVQKDFDFHEEICKVSGNERLFTMWSTLASQTRLYLMIVNEAYLDREAIARTHLPALNAIRAKDPERAKNALQHAIESVGEEMARRLEKEPWNPTEV